MRTAVSKANKQRLGAKHTDGLWILVVCLDSRSRSVLFFAVRRHSRGQTLHSRPRLRFLNLGQGLKSDGEMGSSSFVHIRDCVCVCVEREPIWMTDLPPLSFLAPDSSCYFHMCSQNVHQSECVVLPNTLAISTRQSLWVSPWFCQINDLETSLSVPAQVHA